MSGAHDERIARRNAMRDEVERLRCPKPFVDAFGNSHAQDEVGITVLSKLEASQHRWKRALVARLAQNARRAADAGDAKQIHERLYRPVDGGFAARRVEGSVGALMAQHRRELGVRLKQNGFVPRLFERVADVELCLVRERTRAGSVVDEYCNLVGHASAPLVTPHRQVQRALRPAARDDRRARQCQARCVYRDRTPTR